MEPLTATLTKPPPPAPPPPLLMDRLRSALSAIGGVLTGVGVLILLFVAYQLWGTGLYTAHRQDDLKAQFRAQAATGTPPTAPRIDTVTTMTTATTTPTLSRPAGDAVAMVRIPKIGVEHAVVEGVGVADLRKGPGHYPQTPLPGEVGNAAIAGHRTTYGAPFNRLDELSPGDEIDVTTLQGSFTYRVAGSKVVTPDHVEVLDPTPDARLTLTTCNPKYSAKQRLVVVATLVPGQPTPAASPSVPVESTPMTPGAPTERPVLANAELATDTPKFPAVLWGLATVTVGAAWWRAVRRHRHWITYLAGVVPFLVVLFVFYAQLERLLPANF